MAEQLHVLIVGGGVAGLTLAAKLEQQGREVTLVERACELDPVGYGLGVYPLGSSVLHGLGLFERLLQVSSPFRLYRMHDERGTLMQQMDVAEALKSFEPAVCLTRTALIEVLREGVDPCSIRMGTTVTHFEQRPDAVRAQLSDGSQVCAHLLVGADGMHSSIRSMLEGEQPYRDTGFVAWSWWAPEGLFDPNTVQEFWGAPCFFGAYPAPGRTACMLAEPIERSVPPDADRWQILQHLAQACAELSAHVPSVRPAVESAKDIFRWPLVDVRAQRWAVDRVALLGDAATGFLPAAGLGASTAMRSAGALADELARADGPRVPRALSVWQRRCEQLVLENQQASRELARIMLVRSRTMGAIRQLAIEHRPLERLLRQMVQSMEAPF